MPSNRKSRQPGSLAWIPAAIAAAVLALPSPSSAAPGQPALQLVTSVVNISIPASAFNPASGAAAVTLSRGLVVQVNATTPWTLQLRSTSSTIPLVNPPGTGATMPLSNLTLRSTPGGTVYAPSTSYVQVASGARTAGWSQYAFDVILTASAANAPGTYTTTLQMGFQ